jgi:hypothetical protein
MMASRFVVDVQSVISREKDPTEFGVVYCPHLNPIERLWGLMHRQFQFHS